MDGKSFDEFSKALAGGLPRRRLLSRLGLGAIGAAALGKPAAARAANGECLLQITAVVGTGSSEDLKIAGELAFKVGDEGAIDDALLTTADGDELDVVGQATGRELRLHIDLGDGTSLALTGVGERDAVLCRGQFVGTFVGPELDDIGSWRAQKGSSSGRTNGNSGSSSTGGGASTSNSGSAGTGGSDNSSSGSNGGNSGGGGCPDGQTACPGGCVDLFTDDNNCGACGLFCAEGTTCENATCVDSGCGSDPQTGNPLSVCNGVCVDVATDYTNCGSCGNACPNGFGCVEGQCACLYDLVNCGGVCVRLSGDVRNCGACGNVCEGYNRQCVAGACACSPQSCNDPSKTICPQPGGDPCVGYCVDLLNDPLNCGTCNNFCFSGRCENGFCADIEIPGL